MLLIISRVVLLVFSLSVYSMNNKPVDLSITDRPSHVVEKIDIAFNRLAINDKSDWSYNGDKKYSLANIDEYKLISGLILKENERKEFFVLDIGAGDFQLAAELCRRLNDDSNISDNVKISLISLRGEKNPEKEEFENGKCKLYNFGAFKIEDLRAELKKRNLMLDGQFDFIISAMCFRHLVDGMGTFRETYKLLRPETGVLVFQAAHSHINDVTISDNHDIVLFCVFSSMGAKVLMQPVRTCRGAFTYVLIRPHGGNEILPLHYAQDNRPVNECDSNSAVFSKAGTIRDYVPTRQKYELDFHQDKVLMGNKDAFDFLKNLNVWLRENFEFIEIELR